MLYEHFTSSELVVSMYLLSVHNIIERAKRAHSLFMSIEISDIYIYIGIYVRVVRVSCVCYLRILRKLYGNNT